MVTLFGGPYDGREIDYDASRLLSVGLRPDGSLMIHAYDRDGNYTGEPADLEIEGQRHS